MDIKGIEDFEKRLKEFVGHTPLQVFMGGVLGIIIAVIIKYGITSGLVRVFLWDELG